VPLKRRLKKRKDGARTKGWKSTEGSRGNRGEISKSVGKKGDIFFGKLETRTEKSLGKLVMREVFKGGGESFPSSGFEGKRIP